MRKSIYILLILSLVLVGCKERQISDDPTLQLLFSQDSLPFDTVLTNMGSSTHILRIYNPNKNAIMIDRAYLQEGKYFHVNVDGEADTAQMRNILISGGDSLYVFVRAYIDTLHQNNPVFLSDRLVLSYNQHTTSVPLTAFGQDVTVLRNKHYLTVARLSADKPYLILDTLMAEKNLLLAKGTTLYMHAGAIIIVGGNISAEGTREEPITIRGDRLDHLFDSVPYAHASGQWNGIYLLYNGENSAPHHVMKYVDILSGNIGVYCATASADKLPTLTMNGCRIHNHALYGLVLQNTNATVTNTEISNCASYCVFLSGGKHTFVNNTIASFFGYPNSNLNIHNTAREDVAAVYVNNLSKDNVMTIPYFYNNIVTGVRANNLVVATPMEDYFEGEFVGNYLRADKVWKGNPEDSNIQPYLAQNVYAMDSDSVFVNTHYLYKEYRYFDFHLDSLSPAIGIGVDSVLERYGCLSDRDGKERKPKVDAGCYQR